MKAAAPDASKPYDPAMTAARERRQKARLDLLEYLLEGQPPITEEELAAVRQEVEG